MKLRTFFLTATLCGGFAVANANEPERSRLHTDIEGLIREAMGHPEFGTKSYALLKTLFDEDTPEADSAIVRGFNVLISLQRSDALMVVAEFLEQNTRRPRGVVANENDALDTPAGKAALILGSQNLPDAPVRKPVNEYTAEDVQAWRKWLLQFSE